MATSIECRAPFLDHGLAELAAQIPASSKLVGGELKYLLKRALVGVLPEDILARRKRGFGAPVGEWFKSELRPLLDVLLSRQSIERRGLLSWPAVRGVLAAHAANREDYSDLILVLLNLEIWCRLFMDNRVPHDVSEELAEMTRAA
jgi:asparagine synthase (glutamine-hydrolysing)